MYETFFTKLKPKTFNNIKALEQSLQSRQDYATEVVDPTSITLTDDGDITYNGKKAKMSLEGFRNMVTKIHRIPDPFAKRIPLDLLQHNIKELGKGIDTPIEFVFQNDGLIINAVKDELKVIPSLPLIRLIDDHQIKHIAYSDYGIEIQTINPQWGEVDIEPKEGEVSGVGVNLINSETGFTDPQAESLVWTLICSNGAILPKRFGQVKIRIKRKDVNVESISRSFQYKLERMLQDNSIIASRMNKMGDSNLRKGEAAWLFKSVSRAVGKDQMLETFGIEGKEFGDLKAEARLDDHREEETEFNVYDNYSKVTNLANEHYGETRRKLQTIGGKFFELGTVGGRVSLN
jgi:hypothetical protein